MSRNIRYLLPLILVMVIAGCGGSSQKNLTAVQILQGLKRAGLPIGGWTEFTAETDPNKRLGRPGQYVSKVNFRDTRLDPKTELEDAPGVDDGGAIEVFEDEDDAKTWWAYAVGIDRALGGGWDFHDGKRVLRLSSGLTPAQAKRYENAFLALG